MKKRFKTNLVLSLILSSSTLFGASYYVSSTGNDPGSGTFADPWSEIQSAAEVMVAVARVSGSAHGGLWEIPVTAPFAASYESSFALISALGAVDGRRCGHY